MDIPYHILFIYLLHVVKHNLQKIKMKFKSSTVSFIVLALTEMAAGQVAAPRRYHRNRNRNRALQSMSLSYALTNDEVSAESHKQTSGKSGKGCDPSRDVNLADYQQWRGEVGYWLGELSFYGQDGTPFESSSWPYPYANYRGFITGNIEGNAYRQRNLFLYPPQDSDLCDSLDPNVVGGGTCGVNGNSLVFFADQAATTCSDGVVEGIVGGVFTRTQLVGDDNALLYQVFFPDFLGGGLVQSQLTTLTGVDDGIRTRTAQGFAPFSQVATSTSFYRERRVSEEEFYAALNETIADYNILESDLCLRNGFGREPVDGYMPGYGQCVDHLQQSFASPFEPL